MIQTGISQLAPAVLLTKDTLSVDRAITSVADPTCGALLTFIGQVRNHSHGGSVLAVVYEAYENMAVQQLEKLQKLALAQWPTARIVIHHRLGYLEVGAISTVIAVATPHRAEAYEASRYLIEELKKILTIWKDEIWK